MNLPGPQEGTFLLDFTSLPGKDGFFMQSGGRARGETQPHKSTVVPADGPRSEHLSAKSGVSVTSDAVGPFDCLPY